MSDLLDELAALKKKVDKLQRESDRAEGALEETKNRLKEEFGCDSLPAARRMLTKLRREESQAKKAFKTSLREFKKKWKHLL